MAIMTHDSVRKHNDEGNGSYMWRAPPRAMSAATLSDVKRGTITSAMLSIVGERERTHLGSIYAHARFLSGCSGMVESLAS